MFLRTDKKKAHRLTGSFCLNAFHYWGLDLAENSVATDYALSFSASKFQFFSGHFCAASHTLVDNACRTLLHPVLPLLTKRKSVLLLNVSGAQ